MIVDINIPKCNGIEVVKEIRKSDQNTKIIMLTAHTEKTYLMQSISLKLTTYLVKPINRQQLKEALELAIKELSLFEIKFKKIIILNESFLWDIEKEKLFHNNSIVKLTAKEQLLLNLLFSNNHKVFTYDEIIISIWTYDNYEGDKINALKTIIKI